MQKEEEFQQAIRTMTAKLQEVGWSIRSIKLFAFFWVITIFDHWEFRVNLFSAIDCLLTILFSHFFRPGWSQSRIRREKCTEAAEGGGQIRRWVWRIEMRSFVRKSVYDHWPTIHPNRQTHPIKIEWTLLLIPIFFQLLAWLALLAPMITHCPECPNHALNRTNWMIWMPPVDRHTLKNELKSNHFQIQRRTTSTKREEQPNASRTARDHRRTEGVLLNVLGFENWYFRDEESSESSSEFRSRNAQQIQFLPPLTFRWKTIWRDHLLDPFRFF